MYLFSALWSVSQKCPWFHEMNYYWRPQGHKQWPHKFFTIRIAPTALLSNIKKNILGVKIFSHTVSKSTGPRMTENLHQSPLNQKRCPVDLFSTELSFQAGKLWPLCVKRPDREVWAHIYFLPKLKSSVRILNTEVLNIYFILLMHLLHQIEASMTAQEIQNI